jgi:predicted DNA-binding transcriptional regulator YafY
VGTPERIELAFTREAADYVRAREWHPSQTLRDLPDGGVLLTLDVCRDQALRSWILSFGASAQVLSPETLARETAEQFAQAQARYMVRLGS